MNLFLDDVREIVDIFNVTKHKIYTQDNWVIVRNYNEFIDYISKNGLPDFISFDHDLADEHYDGDMYTGNYNSLYVNFKEKTGLDCAKWLVDYCIKNKKDLPDFYTHSFNPVGKENINKFLNKFKELKKEGVI